jgi:glycosyltransferase involved in cell wall biosynthesis
MKIVIFDNLPEGGAKRVVFEQAKGLAARGHAVTHITNTTASIFPFTDVVENVFAFDLALPVTHGIGRVTTEIGLFSALLPLYEKVAEKIKELRPDVVLVHPCSVTQAPFLLTLLKDIPTVYFIEELPRVAYEPDLHPLPDSLVKMGYEYARRNLIRFIDRTNATAATYLLANSAYTAAKATKAYGRKVAPLLLGVDETVFKPDPEIKKKHFLFVGEKQTINGYPLLQEALALTTLPFNISYVTFSREKTFRLTDEELVKEYQQAAATLCLAVREPFGLSALESMACGTPVVAVAEGGYTETVKDGVTGIFIPRDPQKLAEAMKLLSTRPEQREEMATKARTRIEKEFTWKTHIDGLLAILETV